MAMSERAFVSSSSSLSTSRGFVLTPSRQVTTARAPSSSPDLPSPSELLVKQDASVTCQLPFPRSKEPADELTQTSSLLHPLPAAKVNQDISHLRCDQEKDVKSSNDGICRDIHARECQKENTAAIQQIKRQKRRKSVGTGAQNPPLPAERSCRAKDPNAIKSGKATKRKSIQHTAQSKLPNGRIKKPCAISGEGRNRKEVVCSDIEPVTLVKVLAYAEKPGLGPSNLNLGLQKVSARRREWTPVRDSQEEAGGPSHPGSSKETDAADATNETLSSSVQLAAHLSSFECDSSSESLVPPRADHTSTAGPGTKRRRIEVGSQKSFFCGP